MNLSKQFFSKNSETILVGAFLQIAAILITILGIQTIHDMPGDGSLILLLGIMTCLMSCLFITRNLFKAILFCFLLSATMACFLVLFAIVGLPLINPQAFLVFFIALMMNSIFSTFVGVAYQVSAWLLEVSEVFYLSVKKRTRKEVQPS